jgi:hypothetical protein
MIKRVMIAAIALCVASGANAATVRFKQYINESDETARELNKIYLDGLSDGLNIFNVILRQEGQAPLFCPPPKMALTTEQADDILRREAKKVVPSDDMPIGIVLLAGLRETFPCGGSNK